MEAFSISPFDIPLIVDLIGQHLSKQDIFNCSLVNKLLHAQFRSWCWRSIRVTLFLDPYTPGLTIPIPPDSKLQKALLENRNFIRKLDVWESEQGELLNFIADTLSPRGLISLRYRVIEIIKDDHLHFFMDVVEKNSSLRILCIDFTDAQGDRKRFDTRIISAISNLPCLTILKLSYPVLVHHNDYRALLQRLPEALQIFEIVWCIEEAMGVEEAGCFPDVGWRDVYPHLTVLSMELEVEHDDTILFPFLRRCPAVEKFKITLTDGEDLFRKSYPLLADTGVFPKLTNINLNVDNLELSGLSPLLSAMQGRIKTFSSSGILRSAVPALVNHWKETLEVLRFGPFSLIDGDKVELILTTCSKLRIFTFISNINIRKRTYTKNHNGFWTLCVKKEYNNDTADWNCLDLEHLELTFLDVRGVGRDGQFQQLFETLSSSQLELYTFTGIHRACYQLGRLTKLRHLHLGWSTGKEVQSCTHLNMSINNGLMHLAGLKELEILDVTCIEHVNIKQREVEWIVTNWPKLKRIKGLFKKDHAYHRRIFHDEDLDDEDTNTERRDESNDPEPFQWLRRQRPHLTIS